MKVPRLALALLSFAAPAAAIAAPAPASFAATGADRIAIEMLLATYTRAVSTKDQPLFETLLLNPAVPFAGVPDGGVKLEAEVRDYAGFSRRVFKGPAFTQRFQDVRIAQDGGLADVTLIFVNTRADGSSSWGWKTMQLLKVAGHWKIASEFFTGHASGNPIPSGKVLD